MKKTLMKSFGMVALLLALSATPAFADNIGPIDFESYTLGTINAQDGWSSLGSIGSGCAVYDHAVSSSLSTTGFGTKSLRISDAVTSGCFGDHTFAKPLTDSVGETSSTNGTFSAGTKKTHFETEFDIASTMQAEQPGMHLSFSPDRGDGSRMSYLRFEDSANGINVFFDDTTVTPATLGTGASFNETQIANDLSRTTTHKIKMTLDVVDGPSNDIVKVWIDGNLVHTGTSWEDYYRFDPEALAEQSPRIVKTVLFRTSGSANPANLNNGFLIDNLSLSSSDPVLACNANASQDVVSDTTTTDEDGNAMLLSFVHPAWDAVISGAKWIWATNPVVTVSNTDVTKTFTKTFNITGTPTSGTLYVAADNSYTVKVNGNVVPVVFDNNNFSVGTQDNYDVSSLLVTGANTLEIKVTNLGVGQSTDPAENPAGLMYKLSLTNNECAIPVTPTSSTIHIFKYIDGVQATAVNANNASFPMFTSTYGAPFTLGTNGWTGGDIAYEASTSPMAIGSSYSANETTDSSLVGTSCDGSHDYALVGYGVGNTLGEAVSDTPSLTTPSFTNLQGDKYIIVNNHKCDNVVIPTTLKVHILKYLDGSEATAVSANNFQFPMTATWSASNIGAGTGSYPLGVSFGGASSVYGADTAPMTSPADYTTSEVVGGSIVANANECVLGKYLLNGYKTSAVSFADAATQTMTATAPVFTGLTADQYVIVYNTTCADPVPPSSISGMKYNDLNRNGKKDANEPGLSEWVIRLLQDDMNDNDVLITTATTDANGNYTFTNVAPGTYEVRETHQKGWKRMSKNPKDIVITTGSVVTGVDFGNAQKQKKEKEDEDKDDNRDEQQGHYEAGHGKSNYEKDKDNKEHKRD